MTKRITTNTLTTKTQFGWRKWRSRTVICRIVTCDWAWTRLKRFAVKEFTITPQLVKSAQHDFVKFKIHEFVAWRVVVWFWGLRQHVTRHWRFDRGRAVPSTELPDRECRRAPATTRGVQCRVWVTQVLTTMGAVFLGGGTATKTWDSRPYSGFYILIRLFYFLNPCSRFYFLFLVLFLFYIFKMIVE